MNKQITTSEVNQQTTKTIIRKEHTGIRVLFTVILLSFFFLASVFIIFHDETVFSLSNELQLLSSRPSNNLFTSMILEYFMLLTSIKLYSFDKIIILATLFSMTLVFLYTIYGVFPKTSEYRYLSDDVETEYWEAFRRKNIWLCFTNIWQIVYYWAHSSSIFTALIIVYITLYNSDMISSNDQLQRIVIYSLISTALGLMDIYIAPKRIMQGYRKAYECIDKGIAKSILKKDVGILNKARLKGEKIIGKLSFPRD